MLLITLYSVINKKRATVFQIVILTMTVLTNLCVWFIEQLVKIDFEFLSVSYIINEIFIIVLCTAIPHISEYLTVTSNEHSTKAAPSHSLNTVTESSIDADVAEHCRYIRANLPLLTETERHIYNCYIQGKSTKEVLKELNITENTLKFHNKNIYSKLGVSSRKQLIEYSAIMNLSE